MGSVFSTLSSGTPAACGGWIALCVSGGFAGAIYTAREVKGWYQRIRKPTWTPPPWIFGPVWTTLYTMMGVSAWMVSKATGGLSFPIKLFLAQLALNFAWSPLFFVKHKIGAAALEITALLGTLLATTKAFHDVSPVAGKLLFPYCAWVSFATALNWEIFRLNRGAPAKPAAPAKAE
eukprot:tig00000025_g7934.t1